MSTEAVTTSVAEATCALMGGRLASFMVTSELPGSEVSIPTKGLWIGKFVN